MRGGKTPIYDAMRSSEDAREGPVAFAEKRPPVWKGQAEDRTRRREHSLASPHERDWRESEGHALVRYAGAIGLQAPAQVRAELR